MKIVALAGGVGGAKLVDGLAQVLPQDDLTVIVNTGDDFEHLGLHIAPDLDTVSYTLAGLANPDTGWGRGGETWQVLSNLERLGGPAWFRLGDRDLATHLERTRLLALGQPLSEVTARFCTAWGIRVCVLPMTDQPVHTVVRTDQGELAFQEYFVHRRCEPKVNGFEFMGSSAALPAPGVLESIAAADAVVVCPSNPWVSIGPILAIPGIRQAVRRRASVAISPIIAGATVRGPAAKMYAEMGITPSAAAVADHYHDLIRGFVLDDRDSKLQEEVSRYISWVLVTQTLMKTSQDRRQLAERVLGFIGANLR